MKPVHFRLGVRALHHLHFIHCRFRAWTSMRPAFGNANAWTGCSGQFKAWLALVSRCKLGQPICHPLVYMTCGVCSGHTSANLSNRSQRTKCFPNPTCSPILSNNVSCRVDAHETTRRSSCVYSLSCRSIFLSRTLNMAAVNSAVPAESRLCFS